ncbi:MAG TPA: LysR substrate-binding domain-containing protein [Solirubrobacter sp.]|nr:LysR substrate-binding domain-containing protein [Solirubrobacter sp.]
MDVTRKMRFMVDLRRLRALRAVADHGTLAAAADALHLTPSAVSQQLAALEREVGRALLEPAGRSVRLTPAAQVLLGHADALFAQLERLEGELAAQDAAPRGQVRVAGFPTALAGLLAPAARPLRATAPAVTLRITEAETPDAVTLLVARDVDVILGMECSAAPRRDDARFHREELLGDALDAVLPADHALAGRSRVDLAELAGETWVAPPVGWSCDEVFVAGCRGAGFSPRVAHRAGDWQAVMGVVAAGLGISLVPRLAQSAPPPGVVVIPLAGVPPKRHVFVACRAGADASPAVRAVLDALAGSAHAQSPLVRAA